MYTTVTTHHHNHQTSPPVSPITHHHYHAKHISNYCYQSSPPPSMNFAQNFSHQEHNNRPSSSTTIMTHHLYCCCYQHCQHFPPLTLSTNIAAILHHSLQLSISSTTYDYRKTVSRCYQHNHLTPSSLTSTRLANTATIKHHRRHILP